MISKTLLVVSTALGFLTAAQADCVGPDDWVNGPNCVTGNSDEVTKDILDNLVSCMKSSSEDDGTYTIEGNGVIPPSGNGKMVTWSKDNHEIFIMNNKKDDVCVDLNGIGDVMKDGYKDGCIDLVWDNGDDYMIKTGIGSCDVVYGCGNSAYRKISCT